MMLGIWILLLAVYLQDSSAITHREVTLMHSNTFKIKNLGLSDQVEFTDPDGVTTTILYKPYSTPIRGHVVTWEDYNEYIINSVKFNDQGTFKVRSFWGSVTASYALKVIAKMATTDRVAGETLTISLEGLNKEDISLRFLSENDSLLLVERGKVQVNNQSEYIGRIQVTNYDIRLLNFNVSDVGNYSISDQQQRIVAIIKVILVDHHDGVNAATFLSMMLLGIPVGICCCCCRKNISKCRCRKNICKGCCENKESNGVVLNTSTVEHPVSPPEAPPAYNNPDAPAPKNPVISESTVHPLPNPIIPEPPYSGPPGMDPAMNPAIPPSTNPIYPPLYPPAQPPQWSGAPYNAPPPAGFDPVIYNAPNAPLTGQGQMQGSEISATTPLLPNPQPEAPGLYSNVLNSSDSAVQYKPDMGKDSSTNFL